MISGEAKKGHGRRRWREFRPSEEEIGSGAGLVIASCQKGALLELATMFDGFEACRIKRTI